MKLKEQLMIAALLLGLIVWPSVSAEAAPTTTAFSYQGRLIDAGDVADGLYDLQFKLFDDPNMILGNQIGDDVNVPDIELVEGYFTVLLDFNDVHAFNGDGRWLQIGVRPGDVNDPNLYAALEPRQELTPAPYAMYAYMAGGLTLVDGAGQGLVLTCDANGVGSWQPAAEGDDLGDHTATENIRLNGQWLSGDGGDEGVYVASNGNVRIGPTGPGDELDVQGSIICTNSEGRKRVYLTPHNYNGSGRISLVDSNDFMSTIIMGEGTTQFLGGPVHIGNSLKPQDLEVAGRVKITGGSPGAGKVLTSTNASGLASWQTPTGGGDDLGDHTATQNIRLNGHWLSSDGGSEGVYVNSSGNVGIGTSDPREKLVVKVGGTTWGNSHFALEASGSTNKWGMIVGSSDTFYLGYNENTRLKVYTDGDVVPQSHKSADLGRSGEAWDNVYCDDVVNQGAAAFTDRSVTDEILNHPPTPKQPGMFDYMNERGLEELDPDSLPQDLREGFNLLTDEMTTYNYKANYEQQVQIKKLQEENEVLKKRLEALERKMEQFQFAVAKEVQL